MANKLPLHPAYVRTAPIKSLALKTMQLPASKALALKKMAPHEVEPHAAKLRVDPDVDVKEALASQTSSAKK